MKLLPGFLLVTSALCSYPIITLDRYNHVSLLGEVNLQSVDKVIDGINQLKSKSVYLYIDSPGGYVNDGEKLVSYILYSQATGREIICIAENAFSMAFYILQNCKFRWVTPSARLMQHQVSIKNQGTLLNVGKYFNMVNRVSEKLNHICAQRLKIPDADFIEKVRDDWWLYGDDIINQNAADVQILVGCNNTIEYDIGTVGVNTHTRDNPCPITSGTSSIGKLNVNSMYF